MYKYVEKVFPGSCRANRGNWSSQNHAECLCAYVCTCAVHPHVFKKKYHISYIWLSPYIEKCTIMVASFSLVFEVLVIFLDL